MLNGFVGEFLIIVGSYHSRALYAALAALGVVLAAVYLLWMYQRVFYGEIRNDKNRNLPDCNALEKLILTTVVIVILAMGIYPQPFLRRMDHSVAAIMSRVQETGNGEQGIRNRQARIGNRESGVGVVPSVRHRLLATSYSQPPIPYSQLPAPYSQPPIPYSLSPIPSPGGGR